MLHIFSGDSGQSVLFQWQFKPFLYFGMASTKVLSIRTPHFDDPVGWDKHGSQFIKSYSILFSAPLANVEYQLLLMDLKARTSISEA